MRHSRQRRGKERRTNASGLQSVSAYPTTSSASVRHFPILHVTLGRAAAHVTTLLGTPCGGDRGDPFFGYDTKQVNTRILAGGHPDIVIGCGRTTAPLSVALRRHAALVNASSGNGSSVSRSESLVGGSTGRGRGGRNAWDVRDASAQRLTRTIQIQHPRTYTDGTDFDLIFTPRHDFPPPPSPGRSGIGEGRGEGGVGNMTGEGTEGGGATPVGNIVNTVGSLHRISPAMLASVVDSSEEEEASRDEAVHVDKAKQQLSLAPPPRHVWLRAARSQGPLLVVLVGGSTSTWAMGTSFASRLVQDVQASIAAVATTTTADRRVTVVSSAADSSDGGFVEGPVHSPVLFLTSRRTPPDVVAFLVHRLKEDGYACGEPLGGDGDEKGSVRSIPPFLWDPTRKAIDVHRRCFRGLCSLLRGGWLGGQPVHSLSCRSGGDHRHS